MSIWTRISNVFRGDRLNREIDEELEAHLADAVAEGRDEAEARRALGAALRIREESRDLRLMPWLDSLRADAVLGWRQLMKRKVTSLSAILSLALAIGACTAAFRLVDALLLRPLPVEHPEQLYSLARAGTGFDGKPQVFDGWPYPAFQLMQAAAKGEAELLAFSFVERVDLTYSSDEEMEKAQVQYVSGRMFSSFGLTPAAGRLLTDADDQTPGAHPYAVLSHDYWKRRFGEERQVVGRSVRIGERSYEIVGVLQGSFTGTEPGTVTDVFLPAIMNEAAARNDSTWHRTLARVRPDAALEPLRARLDATSRAFEESRLRNFQGLPKERLRRFLELKLLFQPAATGLSDLQKEYRRSLSVLGVLVALVLLIACANVANLMTAQAAARSREMALRVSIGAGRWRLVQLVLVESWMLAFFAAAVGSAFASWAAPFVVGRINPPDNPARLAMPADWRVSAFALGLTVLVTCLFGLVPALRASGVKPASALKGGEDPHSRRRLMHALIAAQAAFCFLVLFVSGLFVATFQRLAAKPIGFSAERLLALDTVTREPETSGQWEQVAEHLRRVPGVESVRLCSRPLLINNASNNFISVNGAPPGPVLAYFLPVAPGWMDLMRIPFSAGTDFREGATSPGVAVVNETFAKQFYPGESPVGKVFLRGKSPYEVVGVVKDAPYRSLREAMLPVAFVPMRQLRESGEEQPLRAATFLVKTRSADPLSMASILRAEVPRLRTGFRVSNLRTQQELVQAQTVRERLLAMLSLFFAVVAVLLAGVGLYGVLDYSALQRRREISIRMALGARGGDIAVRVTSQIYSMVAVGAAAGLALGMASVHSIESLFYQVKATDLPVLTFPSITLVAAALLASLPAVVRAVRTDPAKMLRAE